MDGGGVGVVEGGPAVVEPAGLEGAVVDDHVLCASLGEDAHQQEEGGEEGFDGDWGLHLGKRVGGGGLV